MTPRPAPAPPDTVLRLPAVLARVGLKRSVLYQLIQAGQFPAGIKLAPRQVGWRESDINRWIASRVNLTESVRVR